MRGHQVQAEFTAINELIQHGSLQVVRIQCARVECSGYAVTVHGTDHVGSSDCNRFRGDNAKRFHALQRGIL